MILVLRGHIRNSFETKDLYNLVNNLYGMYPNLKIFIHTWTIFSNGISWRPYEINNTIVTKQTIYDYFDNLSKLINHIIIDDDSKINLIGNLKGNVSNSSMPMIGWKNYWYGKYQIISYIYNKQLYNNDVIINTRFDVLNNSVSISKDAFFNFIKKDIPLNKNLFIYEYNFGLDNLYIGTINNMYKLSYIFNNYLDLVLSKKSVNSHELLVYLVNNSLHKKMNKEHNYSKMTWIK